LVSVLEGLAPFFIGRGEGPTSLSFCRGRRGGWASAAVNPLFCLTTIPAGISYPGTGFAWPFKVLSCADYTFLCIPEGVWGPGVLIVAGVTEDIRSWQGTGASGSQPIWVVTLTLNLVFAAWREWCPEESPPLGFPAGSFRPSGRGGPSVKPRGGGFTSWASVHCIANARAGVATGISQCRNPCPREDAR
jgi:hypothetical protein